MKTPRFTLHQSARYAFACTAATTLLFSVAACDVKKTEDGKAPSVTVEDGKLPKYDVDTAKVDVNTEKKEVTVPKVTTEQKTISVPDVDVTMPGDQPATGPATATDADATGATDADDDADDDAAVTSPTP